jgi:hypothetical protein
LIAQIWLQERYPPSVARMKLTGALLSPPLVLDPPPPILFLDVVVTVMEHQTRSLDVDIFGRFLRGVWNARTLDAFHLAAHLADNPRAGRVYAAPELDTPQTPHLLSWKHVGGVELQTHVLAASIPSTPPPHAPPPRCRTSCPRCASAGTCATRWTSSRSSSTTASSSSARHPPHPNGPSRRLVSFRAPLRPCQTTPKRQSLLR